MNEEQSRSLQDAIAEQLSQAHGFTAAEAQELAARFAPRLKKRFASWVRRELYLERRRLARARAAEQTAAAEDEGEQFERLSLNVRLQHGLMAISVIVLIVTGIPLKFHESLWAKEVISLLGGPDVTPIIHRVAATLLAFVGVWHLLYIAFTKEGRENFRLLLPRLQDAKDAIQQIKFYLGLTDQRPKFDRFSYVEKFDYWAVYWGMVIMIGSGTILWFTEWFLQFVPKWVTDIAKEAHSDEALLATLAIVIWHFYNVHFNPHSFPMNKTFITGKISARKMREEHPLEYERIMKERAQRGGEA
ncbi:MAG: cytochrome b/b6 domain-containing protein [Thermoanaerobaculum sp.]|nr:cytochrome b/b6 domain-containing protein [Thermoanaerobaculum sp.]MDW7967133.1 cytochrome b/b6 domain-containing protein [Thermoanaerobaculum sp.]